MPEETSVTRDGTPLDRMPQKRRNSGLHFVRWNWFFFRMKCGERIIMLMIGARPVAKTAPKIPIRQGKMKTQSSTMLEKLPPSIAAIESWGAPSLRTKQSSTLFSRKAGANRRITCRYVRDISKTFSSAPNRVTIVPEKKRPTSMKKTANAAARYSALVKVRLAASWSAWLFWIEYFVPPPMPIIRPLPLMKL